MLALLLCLIAQDSWGTTDLRHLDRPTSLTFHPDGKTLISGGMDQTLRIWSLETGKELRVIETQGVWAVSVAISPDGKLVAAAGSGKKAGVWDIATGQCLLTLERHERNVLSIAFSPDGKLMATGGIDGTVRTFDVSTGRELSSLTAHDRGVTSVAFVDATSIASAGCDSKVRITRGETILREWESHHQPPCILAASGEIIATSGWDGWIRTWDASGKEVAKIEGRANALSIHGRHIYIAGHDRVLRVWDGQETRPIGKVFAQACAVSLDGKRVAACDESHAVRLWEIESGRELFEHNAHRGAIRSLAFVGNRLHSAGSDGEIREWIDGKSKRLHARREPVTLIGLPDGYAFASHSEGVVVVRGSIEKTLELNGVHSMSATRAGKKIAMTGSAGVHVLEPALRHLIDARAKFPTAAVYVGDRLFVAYSDGTIEGERFHIANRMVSDGRILVSAGQDNMIRFIRAADLKEEFSIQVGTPPACIALSPDGSLLAVGDASGLIELREIDSGLLVREPWRHLGGVSALVFSPDGRQLYSGGQDTRILRWDLGKAEPNIDTEDLFSEDAAKAFRAMTSLAAAGDKSIPALERFLNVDVNSWLGDLDDDDPVVRQKAMARLEGLEIASKLEALLARGPEVKAAAETLLLRLKQGGTLGRGELARLRAVRVLLRIGAASTLTRIATEGLSARERALASMK